jgi:hypothetical protein
MPRPKMFEDEPATISVAELNDGDFLVSFPAQRGIRGYTVNSGVTALDDDHTTWGIRAAYRSRTVFPVAARRFRTLTGVTLSLPCEHSVVVRRKLASA